jgi:GntR family transcriptional regulator
VTGGTGVDDFVRAEVASAARAGRQVAAAREVVASTAINPNTVLKASREHEGLVDSRTGVGSFVRRTHGRVDASLESPLGTDLRVWMAGQSRRISNESMWRRW